MPSKILDEILQKRNRTSNLQVVFLDVISYSKRRSQSQASVIDGFMKVLAKSIDGISAQYVTYAQENGLNFKDDIIALPAGDGAAIVFPFDGLHSIHLEFAKRTLKELSEHNELNKCEKFDENGWCNCHGNFDLTIGISEGKGILYKDINQNYNVAGEVINIAARVMGKAEKNQILFSENAYKQIIDMVEDPHLDEKFVLLPEVKVKHGLSLNIYQYSDKECEYINSEMPEDLIMTKRAMDAIKGLAQATGMPFIDPSKLPDFDQTKMIEMMEGLGSVFNAANAIDHKPDE